ncbi:MAG: hypothetical protein IT488_10370, partial [Gammaproteobacteria bacterium]|nr:hypothetical protein [Gammaproteobacteria bacterium]
QSVVFVGQPGTDNQNQALKVSEDDETNEALRALGHSIGVIALGRRVVLIEGTTTSLDKQTYESIIRDRFSDLVLVPSEGQEAIKSFATVNERVLRRSIWGVDFFMLCDRDAIPPNRNADALTKEANGRLRLLPRYHLENYFLDPRCMADIFASLEDDGSWLRDPKKIDDALLSEARECMPYAVALYVASEIRERAGNADIMPKGINGVTKEKLKHLLCEAARGERERLGEAMAGDTVERLIDATWERLEQSLSSSEWRSLIPGKPILQRFAKKTGLTYGRLKTSYLRAARNRDDAPFEDIIEIFRHFSSAA